MSKPNEPVFERILAGELRWPAAGDRLFLEGDHWMADAHVAQSHDERRYRLPEGYLRAATILVATAELNRFERDFLVYPIIFCYRHFIELSLKRLLAEFGPSVGVPPNRKDHGLDGLWAAFLEMLKCYGAADDEGVEAVGELVIEFSKIDPGSYTFRYPTDRKGAPLKIDMDRLNLPRLREVMEGLEHFFMGTDGYLDQLSDSDL